jgi:hypothetical protein
MIKISLIIAFFLAHLPLLSLEQNSSKQEAYSLEILPKAGLDNASFEKWKNIIKDVNEESGQKDALWAKSLYESLDAKTAKKIANYYNNFVFKQKNKGIKRFKAILNTMNLLKNIQQQ